MLRRSQPSICAIFQRKEPYIAGLQQVGLASIATSRRHGGRAIWMRSTLKRERKLLLKSDLLEHHARSNFTNWILPELVRLFACNSSQCSRTKLWVAVMISRKTSNDLNLVGSPGDLVKCPSYVLSSPTRERAQNNIRVFSCPYDFCKRPFKRFEHLRRHVRCHTDDRPFTCDICHRTFTRRDNLAQHARTHNKSRNQTEMQHQSQFQPNRSISIPVRHDLFTSGRGWVLFSWRRNGSGSTVSNQ